MSDEIEQIEPEDEEISEVWQRLTDEPDVRGVEAWTLPPGEGADWVVGVTVQEFFRQDPLGIELRQRMHSSLRAVAGVTSVGEHDNESWAVTGNPSGEALTRAAANVVDDLADRLREGMEM
jgi:hypothetical protein